jgi:hypothetical protein
MFIQNFFVPDIQLLVDKKHEDQKYIDHRSMVKYSDIPILAEKCVEEYMFAFESAYNGGCGYDNFTSIFKNIASTFMGRNFVNWHWEEYNCLWDKIFEANPNLAVCAHLKGGIRKHKKILVKLLIKLCRG